MSRAVVRYSVLVVILLLTVHPAARAETAGDLCSQPRMQLGKWHGVKPIGGMTISLPPGFSSAATISHNRGVVFFHGGRVRSVSVGTGPGPGPRLDAGSGMGTTTSREKLPLAPASGSYSSSSSQMNQKTQCATQIDGRDVQITMYDWSGPMGDGNGLSRAVARFSSTGSQPEVFISLESDTQSDVVSFREVFWTASFDDAGSGTSPATAAVAAPCVAKPDPSLPAPGAVLDTALVRTLIATSGPIPTGFAVLAVKFDGSGALAGISVSQSDLPDSAQRKIATLVASNLEPHDARAPSSFLLRVDARDSALHYTVQPACAP